MKNYAKIFLILLCIYAWDANAAASAPEEQDPMTAFVQLLGVTSDGIKPVHPIDIIHKSADFRETRRSLKSKTGQFFGWRGGMGGYTHVAHAVTEALRRVLVQSPERDTKQDTQDCFLVREIASCIMRIPSLTDDDDAWGYAVFEDLLQMSENRVGRVLSGYMKFKDSAVYESALDRLSAASGIQKEDILLHDFERLLFVLLKRTFHEELYGNKRDRKKHDGSYYFLGKIIFNESGIFDDSGGDDSDEDELEALAKDNCLREALEENEMFAESLRAFRAAQQKDETLRDPELLKAAVLKQFIAVDQRMRQNPRIPLGVSFEEFLAEKKTEIDPLAGLRRAFAYVTDASSCK